MKRNARWGFSAAFVIALVPATSSGFGAGFGGSDPEPQTLPQGVTAAMVAEGKTLFNGTGLCAACHGKDGIGTPMAPKFNDSEWLHIDGSFDAIVKVVNEGVQQPKQSVMQMAPKGGSQITPEQVRSVAAYVWTLSHGS